MSPEAMLTDSVEELEEGVREVFPRQSPEATVSTMGSGPRRTLSEFAGDVWKEQLAWYDEDRPLPFQFLRQQRLERKSFYWTSTVETVLLLLLLMAINRLVRPEDPGYLTLSLHPFWLIVLAVSPRYYFKESMVSVVVTVMVYAFYLLSNGVPLLGAR